MFDLKQLNASIDQISETRHLPKEVLLSAIESAFAAAYKREYGKLDQIIRSRFNQDTGEINFFQAKKILDESNILKEDEVRTDEEDTRVHFNSERHIMIEDAKRVQQGADAGEEMLFPLETQSDFGRIAAQSAKQAITHCLHEAERNAVAKEFEGKEGTIVSGTVQRFERGNLYVDIGRTIAVLPFSEQIRGEKFRQGDRLLALIVSVDAGRRVGGFVRLSRTDPQFVVKLFEQEIVEMANGVVYVDSIVRDPGFRSKLAVKTNDPSIDPVGALVGVRGVRVLTVKGELGGEQLDIFEKLDNDEEYIAEALSPAEAMSVDVSGDEARVTTSEDQIAKAIGRGGQNLKLTAKIVGKKLFIVDANGEEVASSTPEGEMVMIRPLQPAKEEEPKEEDSSAEEEPSKNEEKEKQEESSSEEEVVVQ